MANPKRDLMAMICAGALLLGVRSAPAQTGSGGPGPANASQSQRWTPANENDPDQTLEIAPRAVAPLPEDEEQPATNEAPTPQPDENAIVGAPETNGVTAEANSKRPFLGIGVQYIVSRDTPGRKVHGLKVVSVDANSPAQRAGLRPRGGLTELGATGATAGELMAPLNLVVMPLLKKSGQLGESGDLIVAIDDKRVDSESDLGDELDESKPGDTIYFTVVRMGKDGKQETLKIPVKLGEPMMVDANPSAARPAPPSAPAAASPAGESSAHINTAAH